MVKAIHALALCLEEKIMRKIRTLVVFKKLIVTWVDINVQ